MPSQSRHRILIVDDHPMMREGLRTLISRERDLIVCGEAETAGQALDAVAKLKPDLVLADITLPGPNGIELIKDICALQQGMLILVISMHDESLYAERVLHAGARGYIMKQENGPTMMRAIRQVLAKGIYLSDKMSARILENVVGQRTKASPIERLSDREWEVFQLIGRGKSTVQIADELHLSTKTVEAHRARVKEKLDLQTMTELISFAARWVETQDAR
ncbi:MAG TPA: response regulator transcription factor [Bryobacteraceae bacterium]|nr:response regulator transcription factor [Bryobacteraceae bacterium]